jgi:hypothetical protein
MNKGRSLKVLLGVGVMSAGIGLMAGGIGGCAVDTGSPSTTSSSLKEGINVLKSDPHVGVSLAYMAAGRVVFLETRVGPLKEQLYRDTYPNEPQYVMDARVVDQEGRTFQLVVGADGFLDSSWASDIRSAGRITSAAQALQREADFVLAREAAGAFAAGATPELADHVFHLTNLTRVVPQESDNLKALATEIESRAAPTERAYASDGCNNNVQAGLVYAKPFAIIAQHSSVQGWDYNGCTGTWDSIVNSCNHGTCANDPSMSPQCSGYTYSPWDTTSLNDMWSYERNTTTNNASNTGACWSGYGIDVADVTVYGSGDPNHECNDDSALEMQEIKSGGYIGGTWSGSGYACYFTSHWYGPLNSASSAPGCW